MKRTRKRQAWKRAGAVLLATVLAFGSLPEYGLVVHAQEQTETGGTEDTGYEQDATCTCGELCAEDHLNADCPVCGKDRADLNQCKGKEQTESEEEQTKSEEKQTKSEEEQTKSEEKQTESEEEQTKSEEEQTESEEKQTESEEEQTKSEEEQTESEEEQTESEEDDAINGIKDDTAIIITAWEWIDEEEILDPETGIMALSFASKDNPGIL